MMVTAPVTDGMPAKVKFEVEAEFFVDLLDHIPLTDRRRMLLSGDSPARQMNVDVKQIAPRLLLDIFMGNLAKTVKPPSAHKVGQQEDAYHYSEARSTCKQAFSATVPGQKAGEVLFNASGENSGLVQLCSPRSAKVVENNQFTYCNSNKTRANVCKWSCLLPCSEGKGHNDGQRDIDFGADNPNLCSSVSKYVIKVEAEPFKDNIMAPHGNAMGSLCPADNTKCCERSNFYSEEYGSDCSSLAKDSGITSNYDNNSILMFHSKAVCKEDMSDHMQSANKVRKQIHPVDIGLSLGERNVTNAEEKAAKKLFSSTIDPSESPVAVSPCTYTQSPSKVIGCQNDVSSRSSRLDENLENFCTGSYATSVIEVSEPTVGQKQAHLDANSHLYDLAFSTIPISVKFESLEKNANDPFPIENAEKHLSIANLDSAESSNVRNPCINNQFSRDINSEYNASPISCNMHVNQGRERVFSHQTSVNEGAVPSVGQSSELHGSVSSSCPTRVKFGHSEENLYNQLSEENGSKHSHTSIFASPENSDARGLFTCNQFLSKGIHCGYSDSHEAGNILGKQENDLICSHQSSVPEVKAPLVGQSQPHLNGNEPHDCAISICPINVKGEFLEENGNKLSTGRHISSPISDFPESVVAQGPCNVTQLSSKALNCPDKVYPGDGSFQENQEENHFGSYQGPLYEIKEPFVGKQVLLNDLLHSALTSCPLSVNVESSEESYTGSSQTNCKMNVGSSGFDYPTKADAVGSLKDVNWQNNISSKVCDLEQTQKHVDGHVPIVGQKQTHTNSDNQAFCSAFSASPIRVKAEPLEEKGTTDDHQNATALLSTSNLLKVKVEPLSCMNALNKIHGSDILKYEVHLESVVENYVDVLDHMSLKERIRMLISTRVSNLINSSISKKQKSSQAQGLEPLNYVNAKRISSTHRRKRKKTATDSVEAALEEDAPGLLQVLVDKGITVDEIKLYGSTEDNSSCEGSFEELETVISKLFHERSSLFKLASIRQTNESKPAYCLACLISLIEQTRYLRFRKCQVEWGWCRDLQSFIFVFQNHNRIVLERPEYGYATYFFELVESLPVDWQIRRLVTAMKLSSCSRHTLIENKTLLVGEDLTEGEARVLEEYGWKPNCGLGSMLNYCDRVVHDKTIEWDCSDWRSKIGKLLMNGYDGGRIVMPYVPRKVMDYMSNHSSEVKLEPYADLIQ